MGILTNKPKRGYIISDCLWWRWWWLRGEEGILWLSIVMQINNAPAIAYTSSDKAIICRR